MISADPERPNVLVVVADDLGTWSIGAYGNSEAMVASIDSFNANGVRSKCLQSFPNPGRMPTGAVCDALASGYDLFPTRLRTLSSDDRRSWFRPLVGSNAAAFSHR